MNKMTSFVMAMAVVAMTLCFNLDAGNRDREMKFRNLQKEFADPSGEFRPVPLWVWNTDVTEDDIDRMLQEFKGKGFGGAFVHPRPGLVTEYLSPEWFRLWRYSLERAGELGLDLWIYDENSYPSGFAGGHVPSQMPESYNQGQGLVETKSDKAPAKGECFICLVRDGEGFRDITPSLDEYAGTPGEYYIFNKTYNPAGAWQAGFPYVDLLVEGVTEKFIEVTFSGYEEEFRDELGTVIKGTFTDEPNIACPGGCRWTPDLFDTFKKDWGYDLRNVLPLLYEQTGDFRKVRHDYNSTLLNLFIERWSKPFYEYTESKNLLWTGHYWEHDWPNLYEGPDNMAMYAWHQLPAIDMLFNQYDDRSSTAQFGNVRSVKELRSVANQMGRVRTLSETYGGGGWEVTFKDFKRLGDWEFALGVNMMDQHLSLMTVSGTRKNDYPPVFTSVSPWWKDYGPMNDYFSRLSVVLSQGEQLNDILILEPTTSVWMYYTTHEMPQAAWEIGQAFQTFVTELEKGQLEYDLGSENIIKDHGSVRDGKFTVGQRSYSTVVLPPRMESIDRATYSLLKEFIAAGGTLVAFSKPSKLDGADSREMQELLSSEGVIAMESVSGLLEYAAVNADFRITDIRSNDLYHQRRVYDDGQLLFLVNSSLENPASAKVSANGRHLYRLDPQTGEIALEKTVSPCKGWTVELEPAGSALYFISDKKVLSVTGKAPASGERIEIPAVSAVEARVIGPNALTLDFCELCVGDKTGGSLYAIEACRALYGHFGMADPWEAAVQFKSEIIDKADFPEVPVRVDYRFTVGKDVDATSIKAIVERPDIWNVSINGTRVAYEGASELDARTGVFCVGEYVREGENVISLSMDRMHILAEIAPVILQGNFRVENASKGFTLVKAEALGLGSWRSQGYPFYAWDVAYSKKWEIEDPSASYTLAAGSWEGTVASVYVNGEKAGIIYSAPYEIPVRKGLLRKGTNEIEIRVTGSIRNLYGPHYNPTQGLTGPFMWNGVSTQAAGDDYIFYEYGLTKDDIRLYRR
ncbi:MAG: glycosyl hydrolase [Candidatus Cryptobacteroides sp.]